MKSFNKRFNPLKFFINSIRLINFYLSIAYVKPFYLYSPIYVYVNRLSVKKLLSKDLG